MKRIILAAAGSGSGKTIITCGLIECLKNRKLSVRSYKCGPDYIDPMFHKSVLGISSENIDTYFSDKPHLQKLLSLGNEYDISIIEGVMGIYDGLGGVSREGSAYDLAEKTDTGIILIFNAKGMGRTMISLIKGIFADDKGGYIKGIILNRISAGYYELMAPIIEQETGVKVLGFLPEMKSVRLESRHLGLKKPEEVADLETQIKLVSQQIEATVDIDELMELAEVEASSKGYFLDEDKNILEDSYCKLAVARDEAFCFYYEENLRLLEEAGVELVYFSPLHDETLPAGVDGMLLGGGYPELFLRELSENTSMKNSIKAAIASGMPSVAECGGFMYLHKSITGEDGIEYEMVGAVDGKCYNTGKLCRFGYLEVEVADQIIKGHEFHYYDSTANGDAMLATKPTSKKSWRFGYASENRLWGYPHLYYGSNIDFVKQIVESMKKYGQQF